MSTNLAELGRRLRELRQARGLTQVDVAGEEISPAYVSRIESGQRRPESRILAMIAARVETTPEYLLTGVATDAAEEAQLGLHYVELALHSGEAADALRQIDELLADSARLRRDQQHQARWLRTGALEALGRLDEAVAALEQLRAKADGPYWLQSLIALSRCYREAGDLARAIDIGESGIAQIEKLKLTGSDEYVQLVVTLAAAYFERGDTFHAAALCRAAVEHADKIGSPTARASAYWNASVIASERGETATALTLAERALALLGEGADARNLSRLREQFGITLLRSDPSHAQEALEHLERARHDLAETNASVVDIAWCDAYLATAHLLAGEPEESRRLAEQALGAVEGSAPLLVATARTLLGRVAFVRGDHNEAISCFRAAVATLTSIAADRHAATVWSELGELLGDAGDVAGARDAYRSAAAAAGVRTAFPAAAIQSDQLNPA